MGYFSRLSVEIAEFPDNSYPSYERQREWHLEDLKIRYRELTEAVEKGFGERKFYGNPRELRYMDPWSIHAVCDVEAAIEMTEEEIRKEEEKDSVVTLIGMMPALSLCQQKNR